jgi:hypothetical protein
MMVGSAIVGCGAPQRPVAFATSATTAAELDAVVRTFAAEGFSTQAVDYKAGVAHSEWKDTGLLFGQVQGASATIVRRFTVVVSPAGSGSSVIVRTDAKRCAQGGFSFVAQEVRGPCEELNVIPERMQHDLDALGAKLRTASRVPQ